MGPKRKSLSPSTVTANAAKRPKQSPKGNRSKPKTNAPNLSADQCAALIASFMGAANRNLTAMGNPAPPPQPTPEALLHAAGAGAAGSMARTPATPARSAMSLNPMAEPFAPQSSPLGDTNMTKFATDFYQALNFPPIREQFLGLLEEANERRFQIVDERMSDMNNEIKELRKEVEQLKQYGRRNALRISAPDWKHESPDEDTDDMLLQLFNDRMGLRINPFEISRSHRVGKENASGRPILVKFISYRTREKIMKKRSDVWNQGVKIVEDLTRSTSSLAFQARDAKRNGRLSETWVFDGKVFVKAATRTRATVVNDQDDLDQYLSNHPTYGNAAQQRGRMESRIGTGPNMRLNTGNEAPPITKPPSNVPNRNEAMPPHMALPGQPRARARASASKIPQGGPDKSDENGLDESHRYVHHSHELPAATAAGLHSASVDLSVSTPPPINTTDTPTQIDEHRNDAHNNKESWAATSKQDAIETAQKLKTPRGLEPKTNTRETISTETGPDQSNSKTEEPKEPANDQRSKKSTDVKGKSQTVEHQEPMDTLTSIS